MTSARNSQFLRTIPLLITIFFFSFPAQAKYGGGTGELNDPYLIYTAEQMNEIGAEPSDWDKHFKLMSDVDLSKYVGDDFNIIGYYVSLFHDDNKFFTGTFDGNNHKISNFNYISTDKDCIGLFRCVDGTTAQIKDLGLIDPNVDAGTGRYVGSLVGYQRYVGSGNISGCYVKGGCVSGSGDVGGLIGRAHSVTIINCHSTGSVTGGHDVGGLVGYNYSSTLENCYSTANVTGNSHIGGLVGENRHFGEIVNCYAAGDVTGNKYVGGLVGSNWRRETRPGMIRSCYSVGRVTGSAHVGGLVGSNWGAVESSFWDIQTSSQTTSNGGTGKTTVEMQTASTFTDAGWDFVDETENGTDDIWWIDEGRDYPRLRWEPHKYDGGTGEANDPYQIATAEDLMLLGDSTEDYDKHFILTADIDLDPNLPGRKVFDKAVIASDYQGTAFTGVFDGNGHTILHLTIAGVRNLGLFNLLGDGAVVLNLGLEAVDIKGMGIYIAGLAGRNDGNVINCYITGSVSGEGSVGGLVGANHYGNISSSYSTSTINGNWEVGGLVGRNLYGKLMDCYSTSEVCSSKHFIGGLVGYNSGDVIHCYSTGMVNGDQAVGGLVGCNDDNYITSCYSTAVVNGDEDVGGLVGYNHEGSVLNCYSTGIVIGNENVGGLVGVNDIGSISSSFWDVETSGLSSSDGGIGKTTAEMQMASTFIDAGWDFENETENGKDDIWWILENQNYPQLIELPESTEFQPLLAFCPDPWDGAIDVIRSPILSWAPANPSLEHDIYFGEDKEEVTNAITFSLEIYCGRQSGEMTSYNPGSLEFGMTYYWRIDEISINDTISKGHVWSFTTANYIVVDDIEDYNDFEPHTIYLAWIDGYDDPNNGSIIGYPTWPSPSGYIVETRIVHGGRQSMPYFYDTDFKYSEATMTLDWPRDWTQDDVGVLSLWYHGREWNDTERLYVTITNSGGIPATVYHENPDALLIEGWMEWTIDLQEFADQGVDLTDVDTISIGFGDKNNLQAGGSGLVFFDDIRLYRPTELE